MKTIFRMLMRWLIPFSAMVALAAAGEPGGVKFRSAVGAGWLVGRPVEVVSLAGEGVVRIETGKGGTVDVPLGRIAEAERSQLRRWMEEVVKDPRFALSRRLRMAGKPAVLFVGNSYSFQVPEVFGQLAREEGRSVVVEQVTKGGWTLAQHAADPATLARIRSRQWDVVVIQEQSLVPAFPAAQRDAQMLPALKQLVGEIEKAGALAAIYQTWGRRDGDHENAAVFPGDSFAAMTIRLSEGFAKARAEVPSLSAVPVGDAWAARMKGEKGADLYNLKDGSHPSAQGNYLAAAVFYSTFFNTAVKHVPDRIADAAALNQLAAKLGCREAPAYPLAPAEH